MMAMAYVIGDWDNYITANNYRLYRHPRRALDDHPHGRRSDVLGSLHPYRGFLTRGSAVPRALREVPRVGALHGRVRRSARARRSPLSSAGRRRCRYVVARIALIDASGGEDPRKPSTRRPFKRRAPDDASIENRPAEIASRARLHGRRPGDLPGACAGSFSSTQAEDLHERVWLQLGRRCAGHRVREQRERSVHHHAGPERRLRARRFALGQVCVRRRGEHRGRRRDLAVDMLEEAKPALHVEDRARGRATRRQGAPASASISAPWTRLTI